MPTPPPLYAPDPTLKDSALRARIKVFNAKMQPIMREIQANNAKCGMRIKVSGERGKGMFARHGAKEGTRLFLYWGNVLDALTFKGLLKYSYSTRMEEGGELLSLCHMKL